VCKWSSRYSLFHWYKRRMRWVSIYLELLTNSTSLDVVFDKNSKSWLPVVLFDQIVHF
jgi:hypothetical protein